MKSTVDAARSMYGILAAAVRHFNESDGWAMSSHVALSLMMAIFPFLIFAAALSGFLADETHTGEVVQLVFDYWPEAIAEPIVREVEIVLTQGNLGFLTFGIGLALFFASNGIEAVRTALNRAYRETESRSVFMLRLQSALFVVVMASLIVAAAFLLFDNPDQWASAALNRLISAEHFRLAVAFFVLVLVVVAGHVNLPVKRRPLGHIWPGITLTLALWIVGGSVFTHYISAIADYSKTYAGLAGIMTAQIFLYLMSVILILGAEINAEIEQRETEPPS